MIRTADKAEIEGIVGVVAGAFHVDPGTPAYDSRREQIEATDAAHWRVCIRDGRMVGALHIMPDRLRVGKSVLLKGDVGDVSILPDVQGGGIGSEMMTDAVQYMRDNGFDLSDLGGLGKFYSRFGYVRFSRRTVEIAVGKRMRAGYPEVFHGPIPVELPAGAEFRQLDPEKDADSCRRMADAFTEFYVGAPLDRAPSGLAYVEDGEVLAVAEFSEQMLRDGQRFMDLGVVFDPHRLDGLKRIVAHVYNRALDCQLPRISAHLPSDPRVATALAQMPVFFDLVESYGGLVSSMLQVVSLRSLFEHLKPELDHRLSESNAADWTGNLTVATERESISLHVRAGSVEVSDGAGGPPVHISELNLLQMVLGQLSFGEVDTQAGADVKTALQAMFPRRPSYSWMWG